MEIVILLPGWNCIYAFKTSGGGPKSAAPMCGYLNKLSVVYGQPLLITSVPSLMPVTTLMIISF